MEKKHSSAAVPPENQHQTKKTFADYEEVLVKTTIPDGHTQLKNKVIDNRSAWLSRHNKKSFLDKANETATFYKTVLNTTSVFAKQDAEEIRDNVNDYVVQSAAVTTKFNDILKSVKDSKAKLLVVKDKANKLDEARKNSSLSDAIAALDKAVVANGGKKGDFGKDIEELKDMAEEAFNLSDDVIEVSVKVAGIIAGTNVGSLKTQGQELADIVGKFHTDVMANIAYSVKNQTDTQTAYEASLVELAKSKYAKFEKTLDYEAIIDTTSQVHHLDCLHETHAEMRAKLRELAHRIEDNFTNV